MRQAAGAPSTPAGGYGLRYLDGEPQPSLRHGTRDQSRRRSPDAPRAQRLEREKPRLPQMPSDATRCSCGGPSGAFEALCAQAGPYEPVRLACLLRLVQKLQQELCSAELRREGLQQVGVCPDRGVGVSCVCEQ